MDGRSLLHYAALGGNPACVAILLDRGLGPSTRDKHGRTPLDLATEVRKKGRFGAFWSDRR